LLLVRIKHSRLLLRVEAVPREKLDQFRTAQWIDLRVNRIDR